MRFTRADLPGIAIAVLAPPAVFVLFLVSFEAWDHRGTPLLSFMATNFAIAIGLAAVFSRFVRAWDVPVGLLMLLAAAVAAVNWAQRTDNDGTALATGLKWVGVLAFPAAQSLDRLPAVRERPAPRARPARRATRRGRGGGRSRPSNSEIVPDGLSRDERAAPHDARRVDGRALLPHLVVAATMTPAPSTPCSPSGTGASASPWLRCGRAAHWRAPMSSSGCSRTTSRRAADTRCGRRPAPRCRQMSRGAPSFVSWSERGLGGLAPGGAARDPHPRQAPAREGRGRGVSTSP